MSFLRAKYKKLVYLSASLLLALPFLFQLTSSSASAIGEMSPRSINISTSTPSAQATYTVKFTPANTAGSVAIDFCSNDPLVGDTCSFAASSVPTISSGVTVSYSGSGTPTATVLGSGSPTHTVAITGLTLTAGTSYTITLDATPSGNLTNPTGLGTFYGRLITYSASTGANSATGYSPANTTGGTPTTGSGTVEDEGGIALSTASSISITSKVFETLAFCVFTSSCGTAPSLVLGDSTTGALSSGNAYANDNTNYSIATNAGSGVNVYMYGPTLTSTTSNTITAIGSSPATSSTGTPQFGMCVDTTGASGLSAATTYADSVNHCHGMSSSIASSGIYTGTSAFGFNSTATTSSSGDVLMSSSGPIPSFNSATSDTAGMCFLANISATTPAGLYSTSLNLVATGTF